LSETLQTKNISFEKVGSIEKAKGKTIIVAGLSSGEGVASHMLKTGNHAVPKVPEALTIWRTDRQKKPAWVVSGFDDVGLMYALLDITEQISWGSRKRSPLSEVREITEQPDVSERAILIYTMNRAYWESKFYDEDYWEAYHDVPERISISNSPIDIFLRQMCNRMIVFNCFYRCHSRD